MLPAYLVGMVLAPTFLKDRELPNRIRIVAFTILTPFYFLKAGSLVEARAVATSAVLILVYLAVKMATKFVGILPLTRTFKFEPREAMYTTLLMSTGLTFGSISALFGLTTDEIEQPFFQTGVLSSPGAWVIAWRSAGHEVKARRATFIDAPRLRRPCAPWICAGSNL